MEYKALKLRFYPTKMQKEHLGQTFGCVRFVYNNILSRRIDEFYANGVSTDYIGASKMLTKLKDDYNWLREVSAIPLQQAIRHQQTAYRNFYKKRSKYPKFKKKRSEQSASYVSSGYRWDGKNLRLAKMCEALKIKWSYDKPDKIKSLTVIKDSSNRYFVSLLVEFEPKRLPITNKSVGVDLGVKDLIVCSDGFKSGSLKLTKKYEKKLAYWQRKLAKKKKGSNNYNKAKLRVAKIYEKIKDSRADNSHKLSRMLVNENQVIAFEDLNIRGMLKNRRLAKAIADMGMYELVRQTTYKGKWGGRQVVKIDRFYPSSKRMSCCGFVLESLSLGERTIVCPSCGVEHDRDINAAINIKAAGLAVLASGVTGAGAKEILSSEGMLNEESRNRKVKIDHVD